MKNSPPLHADPIRTKADEVDVNFGEPTDVEPRMHLMQRLKTGDKAPDFTAVSHTGETIRLSDYIGRRGLVLFFYPKDGTPVCTKEACAFRDSYAKFADAGVEVVGVSGDSDESHREFATDNQLNFPLISDEGGTLRRLFTVPKTLGIFPGRVTYVIDRQGIIRQIYSAQLASAEHVTQAMSALNLENATPDSEDNAASSKD